MYAGAEVACPTDHALATGFPDFRGGPLKYARDLGTENVLAELEELADKIGERFSPCKLLRETKGTR